MQFYLHNVGIVDLGWHHLVSKLNKEILCKRSLRNL